MRIPTAEIEFVAIHQWAGEDIVLQFVERPLDFARMDIDGEHSAIATADIRHSIVDSSGAHDGLSSGDMPEFFARLGIETIDIIVGTTEDHYAVADSR